MAYKTLAVNVWADDVMRESETSKHPLNALIQRLLVIANVTPARKDKSGELYSPIELPDGILYCIMPM